LDPALSDTVTVMKMGFGISIGVGVLSDGALVMVGVAIGVLEEIEELDVDDEVGFGVEETGEGVDDDDFDALLELEQLVGVGAGCGSTIVAVTS